MNCDGFIHSVLKKYFYPAAVCEGGLIIIFIADLWPPRVNLFFKMVLIQTLLIPLFLRPQLFHTFWFIFWLDV